MINFKTIITLTENANAKINSKDLYTIKSKNDINGNFRYVTFSPLEKTYSYSYIASNDITRHVNVLTSKLLQKELKQCINDLEYLGYKEVETL